MSMTGRTRLHPQQYKFLQMCIKQNDRNLYDITLFELSVIRRILEVGSYSKYSKTLLNELRYKYMKYYVGFWGN